MNFVTLLRQELLAVLGVSDRRRLRLVALVLAGVLGFFGGWLGMQFQGVPEPSDALDHARLLMAETFASGRLSNASLPESMFFITRLVINQPVYAAAIAPGASLFLALGYWLGDPVYGLYLTTGLATWSVAWLVCSSMSLRWGLLSAAWFCLWYGFLSYWGQSYAGEMAAVLGVCMLVGGVIRWERRGRIGSLLVASIGGVLALLCRPMEAAVFLFFLLWVFLAPSAGRVRRGLIACAMTAAACAAMLWGILNYAATNDVRRGAITEYEDQYDRNPKYLWEAERKAPDYKIDRMERYDLMVAEEASRWPMNVGRFWYGRVLTGIDFMIGLPVALLLAFFGGAWCVGRNNHGRILRATVLTGAFFILFKIGWSVSDCAVLIPGLILMVVFLVRSIVVCRRYDVYVSRKLLVGFLVGLPLLTYSRGMGRAELSPSVAVHARYRSGVIKHLEKEEGAGHLIMVRYDEAVSPAVEYVYNGANPGGQYIIWTHFFEPSNQSEGKEVSAAMQRLMDAFPGRRLWILSVGAEGEPALREFKWQMTN